MSELAEPYDMSLQAISEHVKVLEEAEKSCRRLDVLLGRMADDKGQKETHTKEAS